MAIENNRPQFRGAFMGYNKTDVDDYVARAESEIEIQESRQGRWEHQVAELNAEIDRLKNRIAYEDTVKQELQEKNLQYNRMISDLENQLQTVKEEKERLQQELVELKERADNSGANPKTIQDAILSAQRMSEMVIAEANQKAEEIRQMAELDRLEQEKAGRLAVEEAKMEALHVTEEAEQRCETLRRDYDRILLDVTGLKSGLMGIYRKHMELLAALPEKEFSEYEKMDHCIEADFRDMEPEEDKPEALS